MKSTTIKRACLIKVKLVKKRPPLLIPAMKINMKLIRQHQITSNTDIEVLKDMSREKIFTEIDINVKNEAKARRTIDYRSDLISRHAPVKYYLSPLHQNDA